MRVTMIDYPKCRVPSCENESRYKTGLLLCEKHRCHRLNLKNTLKREPTVGEIAAFQTLVEHNELRRFFSSICLPMEGDEACRVECWEWIGTTRPANNNPDDRRPVFHFAQNGNRKSMSYTARFAYLRFVGSIPPGWVVHHWCENPMCVNPSHLEAVSKADHRRIHARNISMKEWAGQRDGVVEYDDVYLQVPTPRVPQRRVHDAPRATQSVA